jgi:hypothetical protein
MRSRLVRSTEFPGKTMTVLNPSSRSVHARDPLLFVLTTMSARLTEPPVFTMQLPRRDMTASDIAASAAMATAIRSALATLAADSAARAPGVPGD